MSSPEILVLPLDSRPVCYQQVIDAAQVGNIELKIPPTYLLGQLKQPAPFDLLGAWLQENIHAQTQTAILALDTLAYGGLIAGRVNTEPYDQIEARLQKFLRLFEGKNILKYAFSSILRIPNYNNAEEEPDYWAQYGLLLSQFSQETHQQGRMPEPMFQKIPKVVLDDFLGRREKNFNLNKAYISLLEQKVLDFLIYCQDDTGPFGFNVREAETLLETIKSHRLQARATLQTGADEVALILTARAVLRNRSTALKVFPWFFPLHGKKTYAFFDGTAIGNVVERQLKSLGAHVALSPQNADVILMLNCPSDKMGDHCAAKTPIRDRTHLDTLINALKEWLPQKPVALADVVFANGADPLLMERCLKESVPIEKLAAYAGWNTPGNTIGSALATGALLAHAKQIQTYQPLAHQKLLLTRLLDDWVYQAQVRYQLRKQAPNLPDETQLKALMNTAAQALFQRFPSFQPDTTQYRLPCNRLFEIEVNL